MLFIVRPILVAGVLAVSVTTAPAQTRPDRPETPEVRTAATVQRSVQPDLATVTLQFTGDGATPAQAGSRLASRADSLRRALATLGIPRDSLVNRSRWYWWSGRIETIPRACEDRPSIDPRRGPSIQLPDAGHDLSGPRRDRGADARCEPGRRRVSHRRGPALGAGVRHGVRPVGVDSQAAVKG